jgi:hypothetical protein
MLKLSQIKKPVYTHAEIIGNGYPEQWSKAQAVVSRLAALQEKLLPTLPCLHRSLPADYIQLQEFDAQMALQTYILARSLHAFAKRVYALLEEQCTALAKALNACDIDAEEDALRLLERTFEILDNAPLDAIASDPINGLLRLSYVTNNHDFTYRLDFPVMGNWSFHDIMGSIAHSGLFHKDLLQDAINDAPPTQISVGKLLDDDTMQRVY